MAKAITLTLLFPLCVFAAERAGRRLGEPDHSAIICDETWSMAVVWECTSPDWNWMVASFIAFRLFDSVKPWPISAIDRNMQHGLGVMLDDAAAAVATIILMLVCRAALSFWV